MLASTVFNLKLSSFFYSFRFLHFFLMFTFLAATKRVSLNYNPMTSLRTVPGQAWLVGFPSLLQFLFFNRLWTHNATCTRRTRVETACDWERKPASWVEPLRFVDMVSSGLSMPLFVSCGFVTQKVSSLEICEVIIPTESSCSEVIQRNKRFITLSSKV